MKTLKLIATLAFVASMFANCKTAGTSNLKDNLSNADAVDSEQKHLCARDLKQEG